MKIVSLAPAEPGWKAVFAEPDGTESVSRILGWAVMAEKDSEVTGVIVDPTDPSQIVPAGGAESPGGGTFVRYRFVAPEPVVVAAPAPAAPPPAPEPDAEQLAKGLLKRRR
jgi:hypothetical protein